MNMLSRSQYCRMQRRAEKRERGSLLVQFAVMLSVLAAILGVVDIGYMYYAKRDLQRIADLAALEAARALQLQPDSPEAACIQAGLESISQNWPAPVKRASTKLEVECGNWNPSLPGPQHFSLNGALNAAHVVVQGTSPSLLPGAWSRDVQAEAIAKTDIPVAAFQVGSQLLRFNPNRPLGSLLGAVGLQVDDLRLLDSDGLANAKITPSGLLDALGVDLGVGGLAVLTPNGLAALENVTLLQLIDASLDAVHDQTLRLGLDALGARLLDLGLGNIKLPLGASADSAGLLAFVGLGREEQIGPAMDVQLGIADLVKTAIALGVQERGHAIEVPELNLLGLAKASLMVIEPPTIVVGPVGSKGYSAQIRLNVNIDSSTLLGGALKPLLNDVLGTRVYLPLAIDLATAEATLDALHCSSQPFAMDLSVQSNVLNTCVGGTDANMKNTCEVGLQNVQLIKLLHVPVLSGKMHIPGLEQMDDQTGLAMEVGHERSTRVNELALGTTVENLTTALLNLLGGVFTRPTNAYWDGNYTGPDPREDLIDAYLDASKVAGAYNVDALVNLLLNGQGAMGQAGYMPPLLKTNFSFEKAVPTTCLLVACPSNLWSTGTFSQALKGVTSVPSGVLDLVGISTFDNGLRSCAGLLSALLSWNSCVQHNVQTLLSRHSGQLKTVDGGGPEYASLLNSQAQAVTCTGALCLLLKPLLDPLKKLLNGLGNFLTTVLAEALGIELGRTDIKALYIGCDSAELVY